MRHALYAAGPWSTFTAGTESGSAKSVGIRRIKMSIGNKIMKLQIGDKIHVNDWDKPFTVCGVSENYVLANCRREYTIIAKRPTDYQYNGIMPGTYVCSTDNSIFGYIGGYHFYDPKWVKQYLGDLEYGEIEMSVRNRAEIYSLDMEDDHESTDI